MDSMFDKFDMSGMPWMTGMPDMTDMPDMTGMNGMGFGPFQFMQNMSPFQFMGNMNPCGPWNMQSGGWPNMHPMMLMMNGFMMQNMMMQYMIFQFLQKSDPLGAMRDMMRGRDAENGTDTGSGQKGSGFSLFGVEVPPSVLRKLLSIDASPEDLKKLQSLLDAFFDRIPDPESE